MGRIMKRICALFISTTLELVMSDEVGVAVRDEGVAVRGEVTYYNDCKPPDGFTGGQYSSNSLLPIEKCCPQTDPCDYNQGYCTLKWALELYPRMCDHMTYDCRDFQCVCCVKCSEDKCSKCTETRGECKKHCRPDEVEDTENPCSFGKCVCCKKCDIMPQCEEAGGTCVGSYNQCPVGSFPSSSGCCGGCFCCKPACQPLPACEQVEGAYCLATEHCAYGFYACHGLCQKTSWKGGYATTEKCYCCIPKIQGPVGSSRYLLALSGGVPDTHLENYHNNFHLNHIINEKEQKNSGLIDEDDEKEVHEESVRIPNNPRFIPINMYNH